jgi:hypothetical protein
MTSTASMRKAGSPPKSKSVMMKASSKLNPLSKRRATVKA